MNVASHTALLDIVDGALDDVGATLTARQRIAFRARVIELAEVNLVDVVQRQPAQTIPAAVRLRRQTIAVHEHRRRTQTGLKP